MQLTMQIHQGVGKFGITHDEAFKNLNPII